MKRNLVILGLVAILGASAAFAGEAPKNTPELLSKGKDAYQQNCVTCHGPNGDGMGDAGKYMSPKPRNFAKDKFKQGEGVEAIFKTVTKGIDGTSMAGFPNLSEEERWGLAYFVKSFRDKK